MKLKALNFRNPENACQSLRLLAEMVRRGDVTMHEAAVAEGDERVFLTVEVSARE